MKNLSLNLFGSVQVRLDGQLFSELPTKKALALLIHLAIEQREQRREKLMTLLWPGMPDRSARHNLRQTLYYLRQQVPELAPRSAVEDSEPGKGVPLLLANRQTITLNPAADFVVDASLFETIVGGTQVHDHLDLLTCHHCQGELKKAIDLYQGDFLADFYLEDSNEFEEWSQVQREAYRRRVLDALEILTRVAMNQKEFAGAQAYARRQLNIDNLRESAYRQLMEILVLAGRREEALAVYESCRLLLAEELGMEPTNRTTAIYEKILNGDLSFESPVVQGVKGYELKGPIGEGAYGTIYRAVQPAIGREVAVKVIRRKYANDPEFIRRFEAEAQTIARLEHPHIVPLYDYWREPDGAYLVMRYLRGGNLLSAIERGSWSTEQALRMLDQVAGALAAAHLHGIVHLDVKPANILLDESGNAYLSDFGIARSLKGVSQIAAAGALVGTPAYVSPEQIRNEAISPQTDVYSLGTVLYETLTGEKPFTDSSVANLLYKHLTESVPLVISSRPDVPPAVDAVIQRATAKRPADRYANALEMAEAFRWALGRPEGFPIAAAFVAPVPEVEIYNPYKGLQAFQEADAADFFGRDDLIDHLLARLAGSRFLALVGPSGSGKSSAVKAGLIPALREGAIPARNSLAASNKWFVAEMAPGTHPLEELELALWPIAVNPPPSLVEPMQRDTRGMLRTIRRILPDEEGAQLLLVIDQFEELFTLVKDEEGRDFFLHSLLAAIQAPRSPLRVVITLRADFYDRPLQYESLGRLLKENSEIVLPLTAEELTWAVREPASRVGVGMEEGLAETIVANVGDQPGALPLLQYALTELFERRQDRLLTQSAYNEIGGVLGALSRRAEQVYAGLDARDQAATRQLFLRLITLGEGVEDTRRRVLRTELEALDPADYNGSSEAEDRFPSSGRLSPIPGVIDAFGTARLLTFDRDPVTRSSTVEVAHEALLREWPRLRAWLDASRQDIRLQRLLAQAAGEWQAAGRDDGFLLRGARLDQFAGWLAGRTVSLTAGERALLDASMDARQARRAEEEMRRQRELDTAQKLAKTEHARAEEQAQAAQGLRRRAYILAGVLVVAVLLAGAAFFFARQSGQNATIAQENAALATTREAEALAEARQRALAQKDAEDQAQVALSRELAAAALSNLAVDPERSILLALQATSITHTLQAENALHRTVLESRVRQTLVPPGVLRSYYVVYSPDRSRLFSSGDSGGVMWDTATGQILYELPSAGWIKHAEFSPDGSLLAFPEEVWQEDSPPPGMFTIAEAETGRELVSFKAHDSFAQLATFSPDGRRLVTTSLGEVRIWDLEAILEGRVQEPLLDLKGHEETVWIARYSTDGKRLATGGDSLTFLWDAETGQELLMLDIPSSDVLFSPDGSLLLTTYFEYVDGWDIESGEKVFTTPTGGGFVESMRLSPDGTTVATMSVDGKVKVFDYGNEGLVERMTLSGHNVRVETGDFGLDGNYLVTGSVDGTIRTWDIAANGNDERPALVGHDDSLFGVAYSPDGKQVVTASADGTARIWDTQSGETLNILSGHLARVNDAVFSPDGKMLATAGEDAEVILWDAATGEQLVRVSDHDPGDVGNFYHGVVSVVFSPDGGKIATAGTDGKVKLFEVKDGRELLSLLADPQAETGVTRVAFSPDGQLLAAGTDQPGIVRIWQAETGQALATLPAEFGTVWGVVFSHDGGRLAVSDNRGLLSMWRLGDGPSGSEIDADAIELVYENKAHNASALGLSISPDDLVLATSSPDGTAKVWDATTGQALITLDQISGVLDTAFSPDGRYLATAGFDRVVHVFMLDLDELIALARSRVTRSLTEEECRQFLHMAPCPN